MDPLQELGEQQHIRDLLADFADAINRMAVEEMRGLFTNDGEWTVTGWGAHRGHDAIVAFLRGLLENWTQIFHAVHTGRVHLGPGADRATGRWYISESGQRRDGVELRFAGVYHDEYRRVDGRWRFARRRFDGVFSRIGNELTVRPYPPELSHPF